MESDKLFLALIPVLGLLINVASHIAINRLGLLSQLKSIFVCFGIGAIAVLLMVFLLSLSCIGIELLPQLILNEISYGALGYGYFHFVNLGETARRIRIIREIFDSGEKGMSEEEILAIYNAKTIVNVRLNRLLNNGQIILKEGKYFVHGTPLMNIISSIMLFLKVLLLGKKSEFD
ncbi:MAG: hypothetical protein HQK84_02715 [Nitrospinae bacterium]|nr:hypothetical protein [Nitrospinota bacterium]